MQVGWIQSETMLDPNLDSPLEVFDPDLDQIPVLYSKGTSSRSGSEIRYRMH